MIVLIAGGSHTGKTLLAQRILEERHYPYLSIDHLKMGLIRSGYSRLTPTSDGLSLTEYLWPVVREIIKTAIENGQNLVIEGCYIPPSYRQDFAPEYLRHIQYVCLIFSENYINNHFEDIVKYACEIEQRIDDTGFSRQLLIEENLENLRECRKHDLEYVLVDEGYSIDWAPLNDGE